MVPAGRLRHNNHPCRLSWRDAWAAWAARTSPRAPGRSKVDLTYIKSELDNLRIIVTHIMITRTSKLFAAIIGIAAVLFTQMAVAAHACTVTTAPIDFTHVSMDDAPATTATCCDEPATGNVNLCIQHCQAGSQSVQTTPLQLPAAAIMPAAIVEPTMPACARDVPILSVTLVRTTSPPPLLRFGFLRI